MATAMHCNLRPPDAAPVILRFNYDARQRWSRSTYAFLITFSLLIPYVKLSAYDLKRLLCIVPKFCLGRFPNLKIRSYTTVPRKWAGKMCWLFKFSKRTRSKSISDIESKAKLETWLRQFANLSPIRCIIWLRFLTLVVVDFKAS